MEKDRLLEDYENNQSLYGQYSKAMESLINILLTASDITPHSVNTRVKDRTSLSKKIDKKDKYSCLSEITDLVGLRIITHYSDEVDQIAKLIEDEFVVDYENSVDKRASLDPDRFGYLSLHYVVSLPERRNKLIEYSRFKNIKFEIQVRSILQHTWAEIEHDIGYKSKIEVPRVVRRKFSQLAGLLELADDQFIQIRSDLQTYESNVQENIAQTPQEVTFDKISIFNYLQSSQLVAQFDIDVVQEIYNGDLEKLQELTPEYSSQFIKHLSYFGVETVSQLEELMVKHRELILQRARDSSAKQRGVSQGVSVFFLFQVLASQLDSEDEIVTYLDKFKILKSEERRDFAKYLSGLV